MQPVTQVEAGDLSVGVSEDGPREGPAVILLHGFPYDIHAYAEVQRLLARQGCRVIVPFLRGYGTTRFLRDELPRSGEQVALGWDLRALMDALDLESAVLAGYDWGGRAACVVAALWPERCAGLVSCNGYNLLHPPSALEPASPLHEARYWYQFYLHGERGRRGLERSRAEFTRLLWQTWSPSWPFSDAEFLRSAAAFDNPDFVEVVVHSYRHRYGLAAGDPRFLALEAQLLARPVIRPPTIVLDGLADGVVAASDPKVLAQQFEHLVRHQGVEGVGHNFPQECPEVFAAAVLELVREKARAA
ncbi:alpha/beta hydrolase [Roseateles sp. DAIF2]|uniref:alpha/beta fold hydrolase n=1 Tax=Roseateles sp. DAIF2 TaxID=2714952 RepID=UPI0018A2A928|nr:alpha/beta hydrolase [Roseateles sp. DAIF2]QPF76201.1 alpha/beta hydrolase [Roseateles sp. DAIF2]